MLDHAVVVATRNRLDMLTLTLPLMIAQSRPAARIVVIDRSDDHDAVRALCRRLGEGSSIPLDVHYGEAANLPAQRNQGLALVEEAVTIFPDDDSMWYPDTAAQIMGVYEADPNGRYGAVTGVDVYEPAGAVRAGRRRERLTERRGVMRVRNALEATFVPQPFETYGRGRTRELVGRARAEGLRHRFVGTLGGYRMSFRTDLARRLGFDPVLGSRVGYGVHEDKDLALRVLREGALIAVAENARVFHNVHPGKRAGGVEYGFFHILNYAYVCRKVMRADDPAQKAARRYLAYKVALYGLRRADPYDRDVHRGAQAGLLAAEQVLRAAPHDLADRYRLLSDRFLPTVTEANA